MFELLETIVGWLWPSGGKKRRPIVWVVFFVAFGAGITMLLDR
jgi:hypothetical protein